MNANEDRKPVPSGPGAAARPARSWFAAERPSRKIAAQLVALAVSRGVLLGATVVVARVAGVAEFGNFALALVVFQAGLLLRDAGLGQAIIVMGGRDPSLTWHAFLGVSALGLGLAGLMALTADPILTTLGLPGGADALKLLAFAFGVGSLGVASNASLERRLRFEARAVIDVVAYAALGMVAISGALAGLGVKALALGYIAQGVMQALGGLLLAPPWADASRVRGQLGALARYGGLLWASALLSYVATNVDNAAVGRLGGASALGLYALSYTVGNTVTISLAQVLNRVALPYYALAHRDAKPPGDVLRSILPLSFAVAMMPAAIIIGLAPELRDALFSRQAPIAPLVVLTLYGVVRTLGVTMGTALNGVGLARVQLIGAGINVGVLVLGVVPGFLIAGPTGVATIVLVGVTVSAMYLYQIVWRTFDVTIGLLVRPAALLLAVTVATALPIGPAPLLLRMPIALFVTGMAIVWTIRLVRGTSRSPLAE
jgi:O-antigen/teichoic acid export membrane protein